MHIRRHARLLFQVQNSVVVLVAARTDFIGCCPEWIVVDAALVEAMVLAEGSLERFGLREVFEAVERQSVVGLDRVVGGRGALLRTPKLQVRSSHLCMPFPKLIFISLNSAA